MPTTSDDHSPRTGVHRRDFLAGSVLAAVAAACSSSGDAAESKSSTSGSENAGASTTTLAASELGAAALPERDDQPLRVLIDTDAANELDDQFALAWALLAPDKVSVETVTAAPFAFGDYMASLYATQAKRGEPITPFEATAKALGPEKIADLKAGSGPADGMRASLTEIQRIVAAVAPAAPPKVTAGAEKYMPDESTPVGSAATDAIITAAHAGDRPLYVAVLGAPTNVASALLLDPTIGEKIVVVFVAGYPSASAHVDESFNLLQDLNASRVLLSTCPDLVYIPGYQVAETLTLSLPEVEKFMQGEGGVADLLATLYVNKLGASAQAPGARRVIWDMAPIAWMLDPTWVSTSEVTRGTIGADHLWTPAAGRMTEAYRIDDGAVFKDFLGRIAR